MNRTIFAIVWISIQSCYLAGWAVYEARRLLPGVGESILVRTAPYDPRDLLRGQYMRLRYAFSRPPGAVRIDAGTTVWVVLRPDTMDGEAFYEPVAHFLSRPQAVNAGDVVIRGSGDGPGRLGFGIEKYFVPEGTETPNARDITVRLRIGEDHRPRIETVYLRGKPWP